MLRLVAIYKQTENGRWDAHIEDTRHISVVQAEDLETAKVILRIITSEEIAQMTHVRQHWDIIEERIYRYISDDNTKNQLLKELI